LDWIDCAMQIAIVVAAIGPVHYQFAICGRGVVQAHQQIDLCPAFALAII
jgi:hypothetical protein